MPVTIRPGIYIRTVFESEDVIGQLGTPWIRADQPAYRRECELRLGREFSAMPVYRIRATTPPRPRHRWVQSGVCANCLALNTLDGSAFCRPEPTP